MVTPDEEKQNDNSTTSGETSHNRRDRKPAGARRRWSAWLNSKIGLLLVGSLITGLLVPWFQYVQQSLEWHRQNVFEHTQFRLTIARDCLREFAGLQVYVPEVFERLRFLEAAVSRGGADIAQLPEEFVQLRMKLMQHSAQVLALIMYFDNGEEIHSLYQNHLALTSATLTRAGDLINAICCETDPERKPADVRERIDRACQEMEEDMRNLSRLYADILGKITTQIGRLENEQARFL